MLLVPLNTDAPIYHFPWATIGLIVINVLLFIVAFTTVQEWPLYLLLDFETINPLQWLTNNFMHAGILHLVGNMFFLWGFGLVVEGKLGWKIFLPLYLGIGIVYGAVVQIAMCMIGSPGFALGASAAIYGWLGVAVIWAPKNDLNCFMWAGVFSRMVQVPIIVFGGIYIGLQFVFLILGGFQMSSEMLHIAGLAVGLPVGILFLKKEWVDCEGWDYFTVYFAKSDVRKQRQSRRRNELAAARTQRVRDEAMEKQTQLDKSLIDAVVSGNDRAASALFAKFKDDYQNGARLKDDMALKLVSALQREEKWDLSIPIVVRLLEKHTVEKTVALRLNLAKTLIVKTDQPRQGLAVLKKLPTDKLNDKQKSLVKKLIALARQKHAEGAVEFDIHDW